MRYWVFTTKPAHFKMAEALVPGETLDWPSFSHFKFENGDQVFFYQSNPVSQLIAKLEIERNDLPFSEADPRNDLRKWPQTFPRIPWLRLRVLQVAPIPFKPLQRGSLYYHTEFKPSPYPKLLHDNEIGYVMRAFDEAAEYQSDHEESPEGLSHRALQRIDGADLLVALHPSLIGGTISALSFNQLDDLITITLDNPTEGRSLILTAHGIQRANWQYQRFDHEIYGLRLNIVDTYINLRIDGADLDLLSNTLTVRPKG
ncbi:MAG: EVE domain-containing protein, partial [Muribaculaceae bacterium]|nr:EVE domain-containing protein [Muribaculaceae bacterium]